VFKELKYRWRWQLCHQGTAEQSQHFKLLCSHSAASCF